MLIISGPLPPPQPSDTPGPAEGDPLLVNNEHMNSTLGQTADQRYENASNLSSEEAQGLLQRWENPIYWIFRVATNRFNNNNNNNTQICTRQCSINQLRNYELQSIDSLNKQIYSRIWGPESRWRPRKEQSKMFSNYVWTLQELVRAE